MLCQKCHKNEATIYYKQTINGETKEFALCSECAASMGGAHLNLFGSIFARQNAKESKRCTLCASTYEDIRRLGKVGCAECYRVFADELAPTVRSIHSGAKHCGRSPFEEGEKEKNQDEITAIKRQLNEAIEKEEYERAAELRDLIKEKESEKENEGQ